MSQPAPEPDFEWRHPIWESEDDAEAPEEPKDDEPGEPSVVPGETFAEWLARQPAPKAEPDSYPGKSSRLAASALGVRTEEAVHFGHPRRQRAIRLVRSPPSKRWIGHLGHSRVCDDHQNLG
jgi:hypothetical protein